MPLYCLKAFETDQHFKPANGEQHPGADGVINWNTNFLDHKAQAIYPTSSIAYAPCHLQQGKWKVTVSQLIFPFSR